MSLFYDMHLAQRYSVCQVHHTKKRER